jgi:diguanylate cyclase (GGDEF)-like protein
LDWSQVPDLAAVGLLAAAFASLARQGSTPVSRLWLTGWLLIVAHFAASIFLPLPGKWGDFAQMASLAALADAGVLFMFSVVPYRSRRSSHSMLATLLTVTTLYLCLLVNDPSHGWALIAASVLMGIAPLGLAIIALPHFHHPLRWIIVGMYLVLSIYLLAVQSRAADGGDLALNGLLFAVYIGCCIHFWYFYRKATAGALITIVGFWVWSSVFVIGPLLDAYRPTLKVESEVWNLPKYLVAVGMILLLLVEQIEHNRFLALHDDLTGLPNRRLFTDRLAVAIGRARRLGSSISLLVVDLNRFKEVNDTMGHHAGDEVLKIVGHSFEGRVRRCDTVARTGGDEFSIILEDTAGREDAHRVARELLDLIARPLTIAERSVHIGASIGVAVFPHDAKDMEGLCIAADRRMYERKEETRDTTSSASAMLTGADLANEQNQSHDFGAPVMPHIPKSI